MDTYERKKLPVSRFMVHIVTIFLLFNTVVVYFCFMFTLQTSCKWLNHIHCQLGYFVILCHVTVVSFYYSLSLYIFCSCCNFIVLFLIFFFWWWVFRFVYVCVFIGGFVLFFCHWVFEFSLSALWAVCQSFDSRASCWSKIKKLIFDF